MNHAWNLLESGHESVMPQYGRDPMAPMTPTAAVLGRSNDDDDDDRQAALERTTPAGGWTH